MKKITFLIAALFGVALGANAQETILAWAQTTVIISR